MTMTTAADTKPTEEEHALLQGDAAPARATRVPLVAKVAVAATAGAAAAGALLALSSSPKRRGPASFQPRESIEAAALETDPNWGCGLVGAIPGIGKDGTVTEGTQRLIDGIRGSSTFNLVSYWNWNLAPQTDDKFKERLSKDFIFMPEQWGAAPPDKNVVRDADKANFLDSDGEVSPALMANIFLGANEPDIKGSCMGNMFGECGAPCDDVAVRSGDCPAAKMGGDPQHANARGQCNCWQFAHATGVGFWPLGGCDGPQPLPGMWSDPHCVQTVMKNWKETAKIAQDKGYKYLSTPLIAANMEYAENFVATSCAECQDIECGCTQYVAFHFYAYDCQPVALKGYEEFKRRLDHVARIMEKYPFVKGAIINEVGMLNCAGALENPICEPNSGHYPAMSQADHGCPANDELPDGLATFMEKLFDMIIKAKTKDGRHVVKGFSWFNENMAGGTYNLRLFDEEGKVNKVGEAYINGCSRWGEAQKAARAGR